MNPGALKVWGVLIGSVSVLGLACGGGGGTAANGSSGNSSSGPTKVAVGQPMKASDGETVTVTAFKRDFQPANEFEQAPAGKECLQVSYSLANGSKSEWSLPTFELKVVDSNGQKYDSAIGCGTSDNISSLVAGGKATATEYYEVPKDAPVDVVWQPNPFESAVFQTPLK